MKISQLFYDEVIILLCQQQMELCLYLKSMKVHSTKSILIIILPLELFCLGTKKIVI